MDYLKIDRFHLVGTAAGGFVAWDYALSFPSGCAAWSSPTASAACRTRNTRRSCERLRTPEFLAMPPDMRELGTVLSRVESRRRGAMEGAGAHARPTSAQPPAQTFRNRVTFALLETISVPTLLLTGDADMYAPPAVMRMFAARVKGSQAVVVPEAGHSAYWEQPEIFNRTVLDFIGKH